MDTIEIDDYEDEILKQALRLYCDQLHLQREEILEARGDHSDNRDLIGHDEWIERTEAFEKRLVSAPTNGPRLEDILSDDANVKAMRVTAREVGLTALVTELRREHIKLLSAMDRERARLIDVLTLLGVADPDGQAPP